MKRLVVTADDVGLHPAMTAGALRAHDEGVVTAVSLAPVGSDFASAAAAVAGRPRLDAGVHLTLVGGERPLSPVSEIPSLLDRSGAFVNSFRGFSLRALRGALDPQQIERELRRQIEAVIAAGLRPLHLNSHQHVHVLPAVFPVVLRLAAEYSVPWVRIPCERRPGWASVRALQMRTLNRFAESACRRLAHSSVPRGLRTVGILDAGSLSPRGLRDAVAAADDPSELVCHPGLDDAALEARYRWGYRWEDETRALCNPEARAALAEAGVRLCGFRELD